MSAAAYRLPDTRENVDDSPETTERLSARAGAATVLGGDFRFNADGGFIVRDEYGTTVHGCEITDIQYVMLMDEAAMRPVRFSDVRVTGARFMSIGSMLVEPPMRTQQGEEGGARHPMIRQS